MAAKPIKQVELHVNQYTHFSRRRPSTGPWTVYAMSAGKKTYIGRTSGTLAKRLSSHLNRFKNKTHVTNWMLQELYDSGHEFIMTELSVHDTVEQARLAEDEAIKKIPVSNSLNIRQRRPQPQCRPDRYASLEDRKAAIHTVNGLLKEGHTLSVATRIVGEMIGFSPSAIYAWSRGIACWSGTRLDKLKKEQK